jgi:DNA polymerase
MPSALHAAFADPAVLKAAWNYNFEKNIFEYVLGIVIPQEQWYDPSVLCAYMSLPTSLKRAGEALAISGKKINMPPDEGVKMFSVPKKALKKMLAAGSPPQYFKDWDSNPEQWENFCAYCKQDVIAEREAHYAAIALCSPMTEEEHRAWLLDQRMNQTGVYIDQTFVTNGKNIAEVEANQIVEELKVITGCENPNSGKQLKEWLKTRGYPTPGMVDDSLDTEHVIEALKMDLPEDVHQVFVLKDRLGGSAYKKFQSIQDRIGPDGRLRDQFVYHGAHTGRESGRGVQLQNLYKPDKAASKHTDELVEMILNNTFLPNPFGIQTMTAVASVIRASFCASPGNKLVVGDLAQIESRVLAALAGCKTMIDAYAGGHDLYVEFMSDMLNKPTAEINSDERAQGKVVILGSGFGMGIDKFIDYAAGFGIMIQRESDDPEEFTASKAIHGFREKYAEIPAYWKALNRAVIDAVKFRKPIYVKGVIVDGRNPRCLKIKLPSGRYIHYLNPELTKKMKFGKMIECVTYTSFDSKGVQEKDLYGGLICENIVQAVARDILFSGMFEAEKAGFKIVMTIHDEIVCEVPLDSPLNLGVLLSCMSTCPKWGEGMGLVLAAEGYQSRFYKK